MGRNRILTKRVALEPGGTMTEESAQPDKTTPSPTLKGPGKSGVALFFATLPERLREPAFRNCAIGYAVAFIMLITLLIAWRSAAGDRDDLNEQLTAEKQNIEKVKQDLKAVTDEKNKAIDDRRVADDKAEKAEKALKEMSDLSAMQQQQRVKAEEALTKTKAMLEEANKDRKDLADKYKKAADDLDHSAKMRTQAETARDDLSKRLQEAKETIEALQAKPKGMLANP